MDLVFSIDTMNRFMLVLFRVAGLMFSAPIFAGRSVPYLVKAGLSLWLAIAFLPLAGSVELPQLSGSFTAALAISQELLIGITVGVIAQVIVVVAVFGGHILGKHMGLAIANVLDPLSGINTSIVGGMMNIAVILMLLTFDYHLILLNVIYSSYEILPPLGASFHPGATDVIVRATGKVFLFALQLVAPVFAALFFLEVMLALMAKLGKQFNVLMLQFPIKIFVGLLLLPVFLIRLPEAVEIIIDWALRTVHEIFKILAG